MKTLDAARRGFTLIELMLVSAIIGLLAAVAIPRFVNLIDKAKEANLKGSLGALRSALMLYYVDNDGYYPKFRVLAPTSYGMYDLHPKYINLNQIVFRIPRYVGNWPNRTAWELYSPLAGMLWTTSSEDDYAPNPISPSHWWAPYPSYYAWAPAIWSKGASYGHLGMSANRIDTKGVDWSLW